MFLVHSAGCIHWVLLGDADKVLNLSHQELSQQFIVPAAGDAGAGAIVSYSRGESSMTTWSLRTYLPESSDLDDGRSGQKLLFKIVTTLQFPRAHQPILMQFRLLLCFPLYPLFRPVFCSVLASHERHLEPARTIWTSVAGFFILP